MSGLELALEGIEPVVFEPVDLCLWRQVYLDNLRGEGTSFLDNPDVPCASCGGYEGSRYCYSRNSRL